jgi:hypothetical protein
LTDLGINVLTWANGRGQAVFGHELDVIMTSISWLPEFTAVRTALGIFSLHSQRRDRQLGVKIGAAGLSRSTSAGGPHSMKPPRSLTQALEHSLSAIAHVRYRMCGHCGIWSATRPSMVAATTVDVS